MTPRNEVSRMICSFYSRGCPLIAYVICLEQVCFFIRVYKYIHIYYTYLPYYAFYTSVFLHQITSISFSTQVITQFPSLPESRVQSPSYSLCLHRHSHQNTHTHTLETTHFMFRSQCKYCKMYIQIFPQQKQVLKNGSLVMNPFLQYLHLAISVFHGLIFFSGG